MYLDVSRCILMYMNGTHQDTIRIHAGHITIHQDTYPIGTPPKNDRKPHVTPVEVLPRPHLLPINGLCNSRLCRPRLRPLRLRPSCSGGRACALCVFHSSSSTEVSCASLCPARASDDLGSRGGGDFERLGQRALGRGARWRYRAALLVLDQRELLRKR